MRALTHPPCFACAAWQDYTVKPDAGTGCVTVGDISDGLSGGAVERYALLCTKTPECGKDLKRLVPELRECFPRRGGDRSLQFFQEGGLSAKEDALADQKVDNEDAAARQHLRNQVVDPPPVRSARTETARPGRSTRSRLLPHRDRNSCTKIFSNLSSSSARTTLHFYRTGRRVGNSRCDKSLPDGR